MKSSIQIIVGTVVAIVIIAGLIFFSGNKSEDNVTEPEMGPNINQEEDSNQVSFNECMAEAGLVIYGSRTCPACQDLVDSLGGYGAVESVYVECAEKPGVCGAKMKTSYVPEIQINGDLYQGNQDLASLAEETGCPL